MIRDSFVVIIRYIYMLKKNPFNMLQAVLKKIPQNSTMNIYLFLAKVNLSVDKHQVFFVDLLHKVLFA